MTVKDNSRAQKILQEKEKAMNRAHACDDCTDGLVTFDHISGNQLIFSCDRCGELNIEEIK